MFAILSNPGTTEKLEEKKKPAISADIVLTIPVNISFIFIFNHLYYVLRLLAYALCSADGISTVFNIYIL